MENTMKKYTFDLSINRKFYNDSAYLAEISALKAELNKQKLSNRAYHGWSTKRKKTSPEVKFFASTSVQLQLFKTAC